MAIKYLPWNKAEEPTTEYISSELSKEYLGKSAFPWPRQHYHGPAKTNHQECFWLVRGEITFQSGDTKIEMKAGDRVFCEKGLSYAIRVNSPAGCFLLVGKR
ncbi:MAG: DUF861 domain-containing protein [Deltaproteobacteria bacterium]|nr:DUF861 domain-containing protein [Deltaproteobacteria bacterium]